MWLLQFFAIFKFIATCGNITNKHNIYKLLANIQLVTKYHIVPPTTLRHFKTCQARL